MTEPRGDSLLEAFEDAVAGPDAVASDRMRARLSVSLDPVNARRVRQWRAVAVTATLAAAGACVLLWMRWDRETAPAPQAAIAAEAPREEAGGTIEDDATAGQVITAERARTMALPHDGVLELDANTRARLFASDEAGATVTLLAGAVTLDVHQVGDARWRVLVDEYEVEAIGTRFRVERRAGRPDVVVERGVVALRGPGIPDDGVRIRAQAETAPVPAPEPAPAPEPEPAAKPLRDQFRAAIRRGDHEGAVELLPARFPDEAPRFQATDFVDAGDALRALGGADAARRAEAAYEAACRRAPRSDACGVATLRRAIQHADAGKFDEAIELAGAYLDRHPDGALARDALGRRMEWARRAGKTGMARDDAARYLERWPDGPRKALAVKIRAE